MKIVKLIKLSIKNFRGFKSMEVNFNDGITTISGANEMGKSSILEAFMWLLFGKDSNDRKDFEIKHLFDGVAIPKTDVEVEGILVIDGQQVTLKRQFVEKWRKVKGEAEETFKGNETITFYNDVPLNVSEYQSRVNEIINETVFKMVTNPLYFPNMKWQDQREQLFQIAGTISDSDIANKDEKYRLLLDQISGKSFTDFKREIASKKRKAKEQLEQIQPRIDQTHKLMPAPKDFSTIENEITKLEVDLSDVDKAINDKTEAIRLQYEIAQAKQREVNRLKTKRQALITEAEERERKASYEANALRRNVQSNLKSKEDELNNLNFHLKETIKGLNSFISLKDNLQVKIDKLRKEWIDINAKAYDGSINCHACDQPLQAHKIATAKEHFADWKSETLASLDIQGQNLTNDIKQLNDEIEEYNAKATTLKEQILQIEAEISNITNQLLDMKEAEAKEVAATNIPEYVEYTNQIVALEAEIKEIEAGKGEDNADLRAKKTSLSNEIYNLKSQLKERDLIEQYKAEIKALDRQGRKFAQQIADLEATEYTMKEFTKTRINESEKRINELFTFVTFRLFEYTIEGNENETCVPLVKGVPFQVANSAGKINAGLDIIKALQKFHGVSAPIFCDNAESVNQYPEMNNQMIFLRVTEENKLTIK